MRLFLLISFIALLSETFAQKYQCLIVAEYRIDTPRVGNYTYLVSYNFSDGELVSKDTIIGHVVFKKEPLSPPVRFDLGRNFIYGNRYVVSAAGNVIDLHKKIFVTETADDFIEGRGDTLVFYRDNAYTGRGYLHLNLKAGTYKFVDTVSRLERDRVFSPNKKLSLTIDMSSLPYKINLNSAENGKQTLVQDAGAGPFANGFQRPKITTCWLDDHSFLYTKYNRLSWRDELSRVDVHLYDIRHKKDTVIAVLDSVKSGSLYPNDTFKKDRIGQLIYHNGHPKRYHLVDTLHKRFLEYPYYRLGHDFSVVNFSSGRNGMELRYGETSLGTHWLESYQVTKGMIAGEYSGRGLDMSHKQGIKVWSSKTNKWTEIEIPWVCSAIGWVEKDVLLK
ncbi:hypothetical protein [Pedobacter foliorum]|uniref:hypothetical protein n=1 Tax=Pedobacter foliorum TaxID=2739058 RepID=UPI001566670B|nr:hypothetical protein [Pedobacter foliorum]NRF37534.1 hypothetical protein [Pedobacter foliorum]